MKNTEKHLLIIRTSAMGDVALTVPVISALKDQYPGIQITLVTRKAFLPFFVSVEGLTHFSPDFNARHKGLAGIFRLFGDLNRKGKYDLVVDLHNVLRSQILASLFSLRGIPVFRIDKGRRSKQAIIKGKSKVPLKHSVERYCDVLAAAGFPVLIGKGPWIVPSPASLQKVSGLPGTDGTLNIGIAPYAKHHLKVWPEDHMAGLLELISGKHKSRFFLFGGKEESDRLKAFHEKIKDSIIASGNLTLEEELALMSRLDLMITMDSSNMHMAALTGIKVVSIWGATDPITGFGAWQQPDEQAIRIGYDELICRPCTVFGKGECYRGDFACMIWLTPKKVFEKMVNLGII
jgi:ADP-heptose:LPS heptosyltransferase